jgi:peptidoglycan biosynthesis protein MviN/MurJ (putative lipid II flippase)
MMLGDDAFLLVFMLIKTIRSLVKEPSLAVVPYVANYDENRRREFFLKDLILIWIGLLGYGILAFISINVVPIFFPQVNCHHLLVAISLRHFWLFAMYMVVD